MMENNKKISGKSKPNVALQNAGAGDCVGVQLEKRCAIIASDGGCNTR